MPFPYRDALPAAGRLPANGVGLLLLLVLALPGCSSQGRLGPGQTNPDHPRAVSTGPTPPAGASPVPGPAAPPHDASALAPDPAVPSPARTQPAVPVSAEASFGTGVTARVTQVQSVSSKGSGVGQIAGLPAVALTVAVRNGTGVPLSLALVNVSTSYGPNATPGVAVDGPPGKALPRSVPSGQTTSGVYVFAIPPAQRSQVAVTVNYDPALPTVVFSGSLR